MSSIENTRVCFTGPLKVSLESERLNQQLGADQFLVRTLFSLISPGTELALFTQTHVGFKDPNNLWAKYPHYPGYTAVGVVEKVGQAVQSYRPDDIVFYFGRHQLYSIFSQDAIVLAVPDKLPLEWAPFARIAEIAYTARLVSSGAADSHVAVIGLGLIGNFAAQLFQLNGARVCGIDLIPARRDLARQCGITETIGADQADPVAAVKEITASQGADIVIEATGDPALINSALQMARLLGEVILLGSPRGKVELDVYNLIHRTGISLKGAHELLFSKLADRRIIIERILQNMQNRKLIVEPFISWKVSPHQMAESYQALLHQKKDVIGILVDWSQL
jgi:threonine dehydrogenase-like Zn-dependent dehydrogenase